jgi:hypothetical protein
MKRLLLRALATAALTSLVGCTQQNTAGEAPGMYATKAEAEKAATKFNCTGAHQMGEQWMPCDAHPTTKP